VTSERPSGLPDYERPPVVEVAIGLQFVPIAGFSQAHIGAYWQLIRSEYPKTLDQMRLDSPVENLYGSTAPVFPFPFLIGATPRVNRSWLISGNDELLIQVQDDRFWHNWRLKDGEYPHFEALLALFQSKYREFGSAMESMELPTPHPIQAEVAYFNWIAEQPITTFLRPVTSAEVTVEGVGPIPENQVWISRYIVTSGGEPGWSTSRRVSTGATSRPRRSSDPWISAVTHIQSASAK